MSIHKTLIATALLGLISCAAIAQQTAAPAAPASATAWTYKTKQLDRSQIDALLSKPQELLVIDVRRPDELTAKGGFPVYLNVQAKDVEKSLAYIPKDRLIITVSNHAHRAGAVGDVLTSKGFQVAGAAGSEDYEAQGGTITRVLPPPPKSVALVQ